MKQLLVILTVALFMSFPCWASSVKSDLADLEKVAVSCSGLHVFAATYQKEGREKAALIERYKYWRKIAQVLSEAQTAKDAISKYVHSIQEKYTSGKISWDEVVKLMIQCEDFKQELPEIKSSPNET